MDEKKHKPVMVSKDFYEKLEEIRKDIGYRSLTKTFEHIVYEFIANKKDKNING